jgi:2-dehydro-3-deoxyphosphooctonate aldolase (KDO 8-P synthase)
MGEVKAFQVKDVTFGDGDLTIIAGPCVVESVEHAMFMAQEIKDICRHVGFDLVYKSSFDKANRSSIDSFRGQGMEFGLEVMYTSHGRLRKRARWRTFCRSRHFFAGRQTC